VTAASASSGTRQGASLRGHADYGLLSVETVPGYLHGHPQFGDLVDPTRLMVREVGDGNLNQVFLCRDDGGQRLCLKQALPWVRAAGEGWPLTPARATAEARGYQAAVILTPETVPTWHGYDADRYVLAMEDLSDWKVWRTALCDGDRHEGVEVDLGRHIARMVFGTSAMGLDTSELRRRRAGAENPELCHITEELVFGDPYSGHERNSFPSALAPDVAALRADNPLRDAVAEARYLFVSCAESLIHGDLHTGSVMVRSAHADHRARAQVIDLEFCCYGPVAFDLGALFGNLLLAWARARVLGRDPDFIAWLAGLPAATWTAFASEMSVLWPHRVEQCWSDSFLQQWLTGVQAQAFVFGACKAIRRVVGFAKAADLQTLPPALYPAAARCVLHRARTWAVGARSLAVEDLLAR